MVPEVTYRALSDDALAQQFMPRIAVPDHERWLVEDAELSARTRQEFSPRCDLRYGPGPRQVLDVFPAQAAGAPVLIWFHGGYWRALSKDHYSFIAPPLLSAGAAVVLVNYDLCPAVDLATLLSQTRAALRWVRDHAAELGGDPDRLVLAGNSAGAHICAMALHHDGPGDRCPAHSLRAAALITGIYDLAPILRLPVQAEVRLRAEDVPGLSPQFLPVRHKAPCLVAVGADEPPLWIDQSRGYHAKLALAGVDADFMAVPARHHFSITRDLADPAAPLTRAIIDLLQA
ncbi:MAG: alpha/beta hydrolase [Rhodospirillaceae bacterium]|nr:alpha/beta hydrolase [Rhodospirillaceae bacterium]